MQRIFVSCAKGLEQLLLDELATLGAKNLKAQDAGISCQGDLKIAYKICLWSRLASRVYWEIASGLVRDPDDLYELVRGINWSEHLSPRNTFAVEATLRASGLSHSRFATLRVKDAIVDYFRDEFRERPSVARDRPDVAINVHVRGDEARVNIDLAGSPLHERGYRREAGTAPLRESLAAAILLRADWPRISMEGGALVDLMCGSGTFAIEAGLMYAGVAPGLSRDYYAFTGWRQHDREVWRELWREAQVQKKQAKFPELFGFDRDPYVLEIAERNAERAGVPVKFARKALGDWNEKSRLDVTKPGLVVVNPPYGDRMGEEVELLPLYAELGSAYREAFDGWKGLVFSGNPSLGKTMGLRARKKYAFFNGAIPCELLCFDIGETAHVRAPEAAKIDLAGGESVALSSGAQMVRNRLDKNFRHMQKWAKREAIECYRVYDADLPEYNVAVDIYKDAAVVQEYAAPDEIPEEKTKRRLQEVLLVVPEVLGIPRERVFLKVRERQRGAKQYKRQEREVVEFEVAEGGHQFIVNLSNYLDTGLFLDHRITRGMIEERAAGKRFLNLFAYTGSVSVYAAAGGAKETTTVDMSATYLEWAQRNMGLNGFKGASHRFFRDDCRLWLRRAKGPYDLVFLDPPTFSNSKKVSTPFQVQEDYLSMLKEIARILTPGGVLIFSNNYRGFKLDEKAVASLGFAVRDLSGQTIPLDFRRSPRIHRCWEMTLAAEAIPVGSQPKKHRHEEEPKKISHGRKPK